MEKRLSKKNKFLLLTEDELDKIKTIAEYLFMDQYQDNCGYPRFEECFGAFITQDKIDLPTVYKTICGKRKKYITFRRLIASYIQWKRNPDKQPQDFQKFMKLVYKDLLKNSDEEIGLKPEGCIFYNTRNCQNRKAISKFSVITDEEKELIKGFQIYYDDFFKNDLFLNKENEKYFVSLEINLIAETPTTVEADESFPSINDRDGITHIGGTYNIDGINFLVFKCRSGKTCFIGKPDGTPFLYGNYKKQLQTIKIGVYKNRLVFIHPHFEKVERFNPVIDKKPNEIGNVYLKQDKPIFEESILVNLKEEEAEKNILQPLVSEDRFYNHKKYQDKIFGNKFSDICPIIIRFNDKNLNMVKSQFKFNVNTIIDEAGSFVENHRKKLRNITNSIGKKISGTIPNLLTSSLTSLSLGDFLQDTGNFDSLLGKLGTNIIDNAKKGKNTVNGIVKNALSGITKFLSGETNYEDNELSQANNNQEQPQEQVLLEQQINSQRSSDSIKLRGGIKNKLPNIRGVFQGFNNNMKDLVGNSVKGGLKNMLTNIKSSRASNYHINDDYQREQEERKRVQLNIRKQHEEELKRKIALEELIKKKERAQKFWKYFAEKYTQDQGIFIIQTIGAVIKGLNILKMEANGVETNYSQEEKIHLFQILKSNRNVVVMLSRAHKEALRRKQEEEILKMDIKEFEKMKREEEIREKEEKEILKEQQKIREEEKKIVDEINEIKEEQNKREEEISHLTMEIESQIDEEQKSVLQDKEKKKRLDNDTKKIKEEMKIKELEIKSKKLEEVKNKIKERDKLFSEKLKIKKNNALKKAHNADLEREREEAEFISLIQEKKLLKPEELPELEAKIEFIEHLIKQQKVSPNNIKKLKEYLTELIKDKNAIVEALNKEEQKKISQSINFNAEKAIKEAEDERKKLKEEEDKKIEEQVKEKEENIKGKTKKISISNVEIPEGTQTWRNQKIAEPGSVFTDELFQPLKKHLCAINEIGDWKYPDDVDEDDLNNWESIKWSRVEQIFGSQNYQVFFEKIMKEDIIQGGLGDCYFLSAIAALCTYPQLIEKLFIFKEKSNEHCYGCYFRINGIWKLVLVDDYIPCYGSWGKNFAFSSTNGNELWVILLEKAWAKLNGNYARVIGGDPHEIFEVLTNAYCEKIKFKKISKEKIWSSFENAQKHGFLMTAGTSGDTYSINMEEVGLVPGHAYTVIGLKEVDTPEGKIKLINLRNPWGNGEWSGAWSDASKKWTEDIKKQCGNYMDKDDGSFWMSFEDFCKYYIVAGICHYYENYNYSYLHVFKNSASKGAFLSKIEIDENNTHCFLMIYQKNPRIVLRKEQYQKTVLMYLMLLDSNFNYISSKFGTDYNLAIEITLKKGTYYIISDVNYRYVQKEQHGYNLSCYSSIPVEISKEKSKNIEEVFKKGLFSYCKAYLTPMNHKGGVLYQSKKSESEFPFSFVLFDNTNGSYEVSISDMIKFKGDKKVAYYFEGENENESQISKNVPPGQWDIFCCMPFSLGSLYSIELKTIGKAHKGSVLKKGLANLSTMSLSNKKEEENINDNKNDTQLKSKNINNKDDSLLNDIFNEEGEQLDENGYIKQYVHPVSSTYYVGFENTSQKEVNMSLTLVGLYEKNEPNLNKIVFTANPMTRRVFTLNFIEGFKGETSFMFDKN